MYVCTIPYIHAWWPQDSEEGLRFPRNGVMDVNEPACGSWDLNMGPVQTQQVLLTTELSPVLTNGILWDM